MPPWDTGSLPFEKRPWGTGPSPFEEVGRGDGCGRSLAAEVDARICCAGSEARICCCASGCTSTVRTGPGNGDGWRTASR